MLTDPFHIIMPVKDSLQTAEVSIRAIVDSGHTLTVYDDFSTPENATRLDQLAQDYGFELIHLSAHTDHPSPNYRWTLINARHACIDSAQHLIIVESDVIVRKETIKRLCEAIQDGVGMVAAVTTDAQGQINFPYEYARKVTTDGPCVKRLSFCCTLLTKELLQAYDFAQLDASKNWYDVTISRISRQLGFTNILQVTNPVLHTPHSSRPWKQLKYSHPFRYYWHKLIYGRDKI